MGGAVPKQFLTLGGIPLLAYALRVFERIAAITDVVVVVPEADRHYCQTQVLDRYSITKNVQVVAGGSRRQDSVANGLAAIHDHPDLIVVHDGVRPFLTTTMVEQVLQAAAANGAAVVGVPMKDTVKRIDNRGCITETLNREELWMIQTPQAFRFDWLKEAHRLARAQHFEVTDDAALIERMGYPVHVVLGSAHNIKITTPEDLTLGEALVSVIRGSEA